MWRPVQLYLPASRQSLANSVRAAQSSYTHDARTHLPVIMAVPHNELSPGCAPLGVLCGGLSEDALEDIADAVESVFEGPDEEGNMHTPHIPIVPLAQGEAATLRSRGCDPAEAATPRSRGCSPT